MGRRTLLAAGVAALTVVTASAAGTATAAGRWAPQPVGAAPLRGLAGQVSPSPHLLRPVTVMPMGDSITDQGTALGYRGYLLRQLQPPRYHVDYVGSQHQAGYPLADADHEGHSGWRTDQLDAIAPGVITTYRPDVLPLMTGSNDLEQGHGPTLAVQRLHALLSSVHRANPSTRVVLTTLIPDAAAPATDVATYNAALPSVVTWASSQGIDVRLIDVSRALAPSDYLPDGVHPADSGQRRLAAAIAPGLIPALSR